MCSACFNAVAASTMGAQSHAAGGGDGAAAAAAAMPMTAEEMLRLSAGAGVLPTSPGKR